MTFRKNVEGSHRTTYANNVQMVHQERTSKIRSYVQIVQADGDSRNVADLLAKHEYSEGDDYDMTNPNNRSKLDPVWVIRPKVVESGEVIFKEDRFDMAMDPTSQFVRSHVMAVESGVFDRIMGVKKNKTSNTFSISGNGILGARITGKSKEPKKLPDAQMLDSGGSGASLGKMNEIMRLFGLSDIGLDDNIGGMVACALSPNQRFDLLNIAIQTQTNLNSFEQDQIKSGRPTTLFGIDWMFTNRLPVINGERYCPVWLKENIVGALWEDVRGDMWNLSESKNRPYAYTSAYPTATRIEDTGVVVMKCDESGFSGG